jgi:hypothetical protein
MAYVPKPIEHGDITGSVPGDRSSVQIKTGIWTDNPLLKAISGTLWERLECTIYECNPNSVDATKEAIFTGYVRGIKRRSGSIQATVDGAGAVLSRMVPRTLMQMRDNFALGEDGNELDVADWTFTAAPTAQVGNVVTIAGLSWPGGTLPTIAAEYFALGYAIRPTPHYARIPIASSTALASGELTITLAYAPSPEIEFGESGWQLIPGYDGTFETAEDKFSNGDNFGGFPFVPIASPNLVAVQKDPANAGKK